MRPKHPETEIIPYLRDELPAAHRERVAAHLRECADCQQMLDSFRTLLDDLGRSVPTPPEISWGRYRAELQAKREARRRGPGTIFQTPGWGGRRWVPLTLAAALTGVLLVITLRGGLRQTGPDLIAFEETALGSHLDLLQKFGLLEQWDLLEDLEAIRNLDRLSGTREG